MTKKVFKILFIFIICISSFITASAATIPPVTVLIDYNKINFDVQPRIINSRTMVPIRAIFESLGISVGWDGENQIITGTKDDIVIKMTVNQTTAYVNDNPIKLDSPPTIINGRTLVPVRFIAEATGAKVKWDNTLRQVGIYFYTIPNGDGNSSWNIQNNATMLASNGYIYHASNREGILKYKGETYIKHLDSSVGASYINIVGNHIFYVGTVSTDGYKIHRVNKDGTGATSFKGTEGASNMLVSDGYIYYSNLNDKGSLYRIKTDGTGLKKLNNFYSFGINVLNEYVYYIGTDEFGNNIICRINRDGTNNKTISKKFAYSLIVTGNAIYFREKVDGEQLGSISRINLDGSGYKSLVRDTAKELCLIGDRIYYINLILRDNHYDQNAIYSIGINGGMRFKLTDHDADNLNIIGNYIYYTTVDNSNTYEKILKIPSPPSTLISVEKNEEAVYLGIAAELWEYPYLRMGIDGKMHYFNINLRNISLFNEIAKNVAVHGDWYYYVNPAFDLIFRRRIDDDNHSGTQITHYEMDYRSNQYKIVGDWIYYSCDKGLVKVKTDGSGEKLLNYKGNTLFDVEGNYIYYIHRESYYGPTKLYKMNTDGEENTLIAEINANWIDVIGDSLYLYIISDDGSSKIIKMSSDGKNVTDIFSVNKSNAVSWADFTIYKNEFYYVRHFTDGINWTHKLYKCNLDGSNETYIKDLPQRPNTIDIVEDYIYYYDENDKVAKIKIN